MLARLFRHAAQVTRRVRQETAVSLGASSMVDVGLRVRQERLGVRLAARRNVDEEAERFLAWTRTSQVDPAIRAVRERAEVVRVAELGRPACRLAALDDQQRAAVGALSRRIFDTLLHEPACGLRELAAEGVAEVRADVSRELVATEGNELDGLPCSTSSLRSTSTPTGPAPSEGRR